MESPDIWNDHAESGSPLTLEGVQRHRFTMRALLLVLIALLAGCYPACGEYTVLTGMEAVIGDESWDYDRSDYFESCGADFGAFGSFAMDHDEGVGNLVMIPDHRNMEVSTHVCPSLYYHLFFDNQSLVVGQELDLLEGEAGIHAVVGTGLTQGTVEVVDEREADAECAPFREQDFKLRWKLEYGSEATGTWLTATGEDWVGIGLPMAYGDPGC